MSHEITRSTKEEIIKVLQKNKNWHADILTTLLLMHGLNNNASQKVCWIDPGLFELVVTGSEKHPNYKKNRASLYEKLNNDRMITLLIPIHNKTHWSLLVYRPRYRAWYSCDSSAPFHSDYVKSILCRLCERNFIKDNENHQVLVYNKLYRQDSDFECGLYTLLYALVFVLAENKPTDEYHAYLDNELGQINEKTRLTYKNKLIHILSQREDSNKEEEEEEEED